MQIINEELILPDIIASNNFEALDFMSENLFKLGYVKETFIDAVKEREKNFPTGLFVSDKISVAIPHADRGHVNKIGISFGRLENPVKFALMGSPEKSTNVNIIVMLAIDDPNAHMQYLAKIVDIFSDETLLTQLTECHTSKEIFNSLSFLNAD